MSDSRDGTADELTAALFGSVCHDLGSPLSSLTANVTLAQELLTEARPDGPSARAAQDLSEMLADMGAAIGKMTALVADLRDLVGARPEEGAVRVEVAVQTALRLARLPISRARLEVAASDLGEGELALDRSALVCALARAFVAVARSSTAVSRVVVERTVDGAGVLFVLPGATVDRPRLAKSLDSVLVSFGRAGGALTLGDGANETVRVTLTGPLALRSREGRGAPGRESDT